MFAMKSKLNESTKQIFPIALIVLFLSVFVTPIETDKMLLFLGGVLLLIFGMSLFTLGSEMSMQPLGAHIGSALASSGKIWLLAFISFLIGVAVTVSEPDLQILAEQIPSIENTILIITVSVGVGIFLIFALLRIVFGISLTLLLFLFYAAVFAVSAFVSPEIRCIAFDAGGVTTGPMTVPFLMSLGAGVSASRSKDKSRDDSFGITALCSIGPILSVLILGIVMQISGGSYTEPISPKIYSTQSVFFAFADHITDSMLDVAKALLPIVIFTVLFEVVTLTFGKKQLIRIAVGILYVFIGLSVFLTGANIGFVPMGTAIGKGLIATGTPILLIPAAAILGFFIVKAEPSVFVLNRLVEEMSAGAISGKTTGLGLSVGVAAALGLSALRILTGISILWILIPGYAVALILAFFTPRIFVGIAFDSGGVASGTMMSAFVLPLAVGACNMLGRSAAIMTDAFGCVAFVALAPIIVIEIMGILSSAKAKRNKRCFVNAEETFIVY